MRINDACVVEIYDPLAQQYCCNNLALAVNDGVYSVCFMYREHKYALFINGKNPRQESSYLYHCPKCGKHIDEDEQ